jgi:hypothetical protein
MSYSFSPYPIYPINESNKKKIEKKNFFFENLLTDNRKVPSGHAIAHSTRFDRNSIGDWSYPGGRQVLHYYQGQSSAAEQQQLWVPEGMGTIECCTFAKSSFVP